MTTPVQLRPLGIGEVLDVALKIVWRNAGTLLRVVVFVVFPVQVVSALVTASATPDRLNTSSGSFGTTGTVSRSDLGAVVAAVLVVAVLGFIASTLASGACFRAIASAYLGERTGWRSSLGYALSHVHSLLWVTILGGLLAGLGTIACILPGIYLWVAFSVAVPALLTEGVRGRKALGRSRALVRGYWWRVFAVGALGYLLSGILSGVISGLVVGVSTVSAGQATIAGIVVSIVAGTVSKALTTPFVAAFITVLYFDLRVRKEAFDLQLLAERIGVEPPAGALAAPGPLVPPAQDDDRPPFWPPPPGWKPGGGSE
jgi:hypothetical protein